MENKEGMTKEELREQLFLLLFRRTKRIAEQSDANPIIENRIAENIAILGDMLDSMGLETEV